MAPRPVTARSTQAPSVQTPGTPGSAVPAQPAPVASTPSSADAPFAPAIQPWRDEPAARHATVGKPGGIVEGSFDITAVMPTLPKVRCDYRIPLGADGLPLATAADLVLLFPYPTEKAAINGIAGELSNRWGFTTLSLRFPGMEPEAGIGREDHGRYYIWPESGSGKAWVEAVERVCAIGGFPRRSVFATGRSAGGSAAGLFAEAYPDLVAAVANEAGRVYPQQPRFPGPTLIAHGARDFVVPTILAHVERAGSAGLSPQCFTYPPSWDGRGSNPIWQHSIHGAAKTAMWQWLAGVADLRLANAGTIPSRSAWPVQEAGITYPSPGMLSSIHEVTPRARQRSVGGVTIAIAMPAPARRPIGLVILAESSQSEHEEDALLDAEFLADNGWLVLAASSDGPPVLAAIRSALAGSELVAARDLPWMLVLDDPPALAPFIGLQLRSPSGVVVCRARLPVLHEVGTMKVPVALIDQEQRLDQIRQRFALIQAATWRPLRDGTGDAWHRERCTALLAQVKAWLPR